MKTRVTEDSNAEKGLQSLIGKRLYELRAAMVPKLTQEGLSEKLGIGKNAVLRLELGLGTIENFLLLLNFYLDLGYNPNYLIAKDNSVFHPMLQPQDVPEQVEKYFQIPD